MKIHVALLTKNDPLGERATTLVVFIPKCVTIYCII